jgi:hypothetical protein
VSNILQLWFAKLAKVVRRRFHVPPAKIHEKPVFCVQKLFSQKRKNISYIFFDIPKGDTFK